MYKVEVIADNSGTWTGNALTFDTVEKAEQYARDLSMRWTAVRQWRVWDMEAGKPVSSGNLKLIYISVATYKKLQELARDKGDTPAKVREVIEQLVHDAETVQADHEE